MVAYCLAVCFACGAVLCKEIGAKGSGFRVRGSGFRVWSVGVRVDVQGLRFQELGFGV